MRWTKYEIEKLLSMKNQNMSWLQVEEEFKKDKRCSARPWETLRSKFRNISYKIARQVQHDNKTLMRKILKTILKEKTVSIKYLSERFGMSEDDVVNVVEALKGEEYDVLVEGHIVRLGTRAKTVELDVPGNRLRLGVFSDIHLGSHYMQLTRLNQFIQETEDVDVYVDCGDISDGTMMYRGHPYETFLQGSEQHTAFARQHYPENNQP